MAARTRGSDGSLGAAPDKVRLAALATPLNDAAPNNAWRASTDGQAWAALVTAAEAGLADDVRTRVTSGLAQMACRASFGDGAVGGQKAGTHLAVVADAGIDLCLDRRDVVLGQRLRMAEIEAQAVRGDQRAFLRHMLAEAVPQRLMKQMRDRMIGAQLPPPAALDPRPAAA